MKPLDNAASTRGAPPDPTGASDHEPTGLPWLHTWPAVYLFVLGCFIAWVALLFAITRLY